MDSKKKDKEKLPTSSFQQQNLKAWQPLLTPKLVITTFWLISVVFSIIGAVVLTASATVVEYTVRYDNKIGLKETGNVTIAIDRDMHPPIFFYYQLTDFYQNHRRYVKSRSDPQLRGELDYTKSSPTTSSCEPLEKDPESGKILYPCGLIANSFFNDTFNYPVFEKNGIKTQVQWTKKNIAWKSDIEKKFVNVDTSTKEFNDTYSRTRSGVLLPMPEDEDFIVWMRTAGLPNFKKLNKRIELGHVKIPAGSTFVVSITNEFPVKEFGGTKSIVLSTTSWIGGKNEFLGWAYITVGILCFILAVAFCCKNIHSPRRLGDMTYFQFSGNRGHN